jgi:hypothetical protein
MILHMQLNPAKVPAGDLPLSGTPAGTLHVVLGDQTADVPLVTNGSLSGPSLMWRLFRINF